MFAPVYFDHNASTPLDPAVLEAMLPYLSQQFGNASSRHEYGRAARRAIDEARSQVDAAPLAGGDTVYLQQQYYSLEALAAVGRIDHVIAILSPLDRLVFDRKGMADLFGFDFQLGMYKPVEARRWGYWAMPVLDGDELVGKVDATADREGGVLIVDAVHEDGDWSAARRRRVDVELDALGEWLGLEVVRSS